MRCAALTHESSLPPELCWACAGRGTRWRWELTALPRWPFLKARWKFCQSTHLSRARASGRASCVAMECGKLHGVSHCHLVLPPKNGAAGSPYGAWQDRREPLKWVRRRGPTPRRLHRSEGSGGEPLGETLAEGSVRPSRRAWWTHPWVTLPHPAPARFHVAHVRRFS